MRPTPEESVRWVVDGMNVIGTRPDGWWKHRDRAVGNLVVALEAFARDNDTAVTVVFDGPPPAGWAGREGVEVVWAPSPLRNAADDEIVRRLGEGKRDEKVLVVTSDGDLAERVRAAGAEVERAGSFRRRLDERI